MIFFFSFLFLFFLIFFLFILFWRGFELNSPIKSDRRADNLRVFFVWRLNIFANLTDLLLCGSFSNLEQTVLRTADCLTLKTFSEKNVFTAEDRARSTPTENTAELFIV